MAHELVEPTTADPVPAEGPIASPVEKVITAARDSLNVRRVVGDPVVHGDTLLLPVARVRGGSGMGYGSGALDARGRTAGARPDAWDEHDGERGSDAAGGGQGDGGGGGFGASARVLGVYAVQDGRVTWHPALDLDRVILAGQAVGAVIAVSLAWALRRRRRR